MTSETNIKDFMTVDGLTFPKTIQLNAGGQVLDIAMEKITINGKVSKKAFKQALGKLFRDQHIVFTKPGIQLVDVADDAATWAISQLGPQPILPQETVMAEVTTALPRHYIRCTDDRTIPPVFQRTMTEDWRGGQVIDMATSPSPFLSDPAGLAAHLAALA